MKKAVTSIWRRKWMAMGALLAAIAIFAAFSYERKPAAQYFTAKAEHGDVRDVVQATGAIQAVTTVQVGSQVSGTIQKLYVDFNSKVKAGQVIAQIDPSLLQGAVLQAEADLQNSSANLASAKAELVKAQAGAGQLQSQYERTAALAAQGVMSQQQLDVDKSNADAAKASVNAANAQVAQAGAQVAQKRAAVAVAKTNLNYTTIKSPIDGTVVARNVDVGQTVAASLQAPTLFTIAQDLTKMQVQVATDESDVGQIKVGQPVAFAVDAFPRETFRGTVSQIRLNATTVQNVVTYTTIVNFDNPERKLFPGMTAYVNVPVATATDVLKVPNSALRYKPDLQPDQMNALLAKAGIAAASTGAKRMRSQNGGGTTAPGGAAQSHSGGQGDVAVVWKLGKDKSLAPVQVRTGITDHTFTAVAQVLKGTLNPGDELVAGSMTASQKPSGSSPMTGASRGMGR
jgi:HlyD family secretion protein